MTKPKNPKSKTGPEPSPEPLPLSQRPVPVCPGQEAVRAKYPRPPSVGEISGFGGGYEATCLNMMYAAVQVMDPKKGPILRRYNKLQAAYAKAKKAGDLKKAEQVKPTFARVLGPLDSYVEKAMMEACHNDCTGAMHGAAKMHAFQAVILGPKEYVRQLVEHRKKNP